LRFCKNFNAPTNKAAEELMAMAGADDDAYRLLPLRVQERVVAALIGAGRLAANSRPESPLLRMSYAGKRARACTACPFTAAATKTTRCSSSTRFSPSTKPATSNSNARRRGL